MDETDIKILFLVDKINSRWLVNGNLVTWYNLTFSHVVQFDVYVILNLTNE